MKKLFELHQKITLMVNEYHVLKDMPDGTQRQVGFARQKRLALREHFTLFSDDSQTTPVAVSQARTVLDFGAVYDITDPSGKPLASVQKEFKKSLINSTWSIYSSQDLKDKVFTLKEKSQAIAIFRRLWEILPYANDFPFPIKYHFIFRSGDKVAGEYIKTTRFRDRYAMYMQDEFADKIDERALIMMAVLLDAMQSR